jgi:hypothetical protein
MLLRSGGREPAAALAVLEALPYARHKTIGADEAYDTAAFVAANRTADVTPHVAQTINAHRGSNIGGRMHGYLCSKAATYNLIRLKVAGSRISLLEGVQGISPALGR